MTEEEISQITNSVKSEMEIWLLEQKIVNLENTLSNTISFFSTWTAMAGVFLAIVVVIAGWVMKNVFDNRLKQVKSNASDVAEDLKIIKVIKSEVDSKYNAVIAAEEYVKSLETSLNKALEIGEYQGIEIDFLKNKVDFERIMNQLTNLAIKIDHSLNTITTEDVKRIRSEEKDEDSLGEFTSQNEKYKECMETINFFNEFSYNIEDYLSDLEEGEDWGVLEELKEELRSLKDYYKYLSGFK